MAVIFAQRHAAEASPDWCLLAFCRRWRELYREWQRRLQYWYGDANHLYKTELRPLLERIAATPAETDEGFAAKLAIILEDDLCTAVASICERMGTDCPSRYLDIRELMSKGAPKKRGRKPA